MRNVKFVLIVENPNINLNITVEEPELFDANCVKITLNKKTKLLKTPVVSDEGVKFRRNTVHVKPRIITVPEESEVSEIPEDDAGAESECTIPKSNIKQHQNTQKHKMKTEMKKTSGALQNFLTSDNKSRCQGSSDDENIIAAELALTFHTVKHNLSYNSMDCLNKLNKIVFVDSKIARLELKWTEQS
ncbi:unnamed protein product [Parnassius apollo]|uniref:(apollo) hypothetical protein n=1 Tax=Parnassius apollo TaxID=110799 RepID=A0A8S3Y698_PARAO|nr:unnamed protein product [Parnassius apollo]